MELKYSHNLSFDNNTTSSNRTFMELKCVTRYKTERVGRF